MNWVDVVVLAVLAFSALLGFLRGMVREVLGLAAWIGAGFAAAWLYPQTQPVAERLIANPDVARPVAFGVVFLVVVIALSLIAGLLGGVVRRSALGGLDRSLGLLYGVARGGAVAVIAYLVANAVEPADHWPAEVSQARTLPYIYDGANWAAQRLPETYRPSLPAPVSGRQASSAELLRANPIGRALGAPPPRP